MLQADVAIPGPQGPDDLVHLLPPTDLKPQSVSCPWKRKKKSVRSAAQILSFP